MKNFSTGRGGAGKAFSKLNQMTRVDKMNAQIRNHKLKLAKAKAATTSAAQKDGKQ